MTVARAEYILRGIPPDLRHELRDILRSLIAGLDPTAADAALVDLFREVQILDDVIMESYGFVQSNNGPIEPPF